MVASILLKKILLEADSETWVNIRKHYLPLEYHSVYKVINKHFEEASGLPSFDALKLSVRNDAILNKIYAIESSETVEIDNGQLLEYLKNEYTQEEIMDQIGNYLEESIMMESAKENVKKLQDIIIHVENKVDLEDPAESMQKIDLFDSTEDLDRLFSLGLNSEYDQRVKFSPGDYILIGGRRGAGKSLTCANIAVNEYESNNKSSIYFTIEMTSRAILQRMCSISTGVPASSLRLRNLSHGEWQTVAKWWSDRRKGGHKAFLKYKTHQNFDTLHSDLTKLELADKQLEVVYDPHLSLAKIRSELDRKVEKLKPSVILVDYVNQLKRGSYSGQYDWTEQIEISKALKSMAQDYEVPIVSPYQTDATGEARFAKGLLDSADAAYSLKSWTKKDECLTFENVKMRNYDEISFTSKMNWSTLKIGPESAVPPDAKKSETTENYDDMV